MKRTGIAFAAALILIGLHASPATAQSNAWDGTTVTGITEGNGSQSTPYLISSGAELAFVAQQVNAGSSAYNGAAVYYRLDADIDLNNKAWTPVGQSSSQTFKAVFDGAGHTISGLYVSRSGTNLAGLFGMIDGGSVSNLHVEIGADGVTGAKYVGGLAGKVHFGNIDSCSVSGNVSGKQHVGLLAGMLGPDDINGVTTYDSTTNAGTAQRCRVSGTATATSTDGRVGGFVGCLVRSYVVKNCYSDAAVAVTAAAQHRGGFAGEVYGGTIQYCYSTGSVATSYLASPIGGFVGGVGEPNATNPGSVTNCYYDSTVNASISNTKTSENVGMSTTALQTQTTYTGWDFTSTWTIAAGEYPKLAWEVSAIALTVTLSESTVPYDGNPKEPAVTVTTGDGTTLTADDYDVSYANNTNVGTATVTVTGKGTYADARGTATFSITPIEYTGTLTPLAGLKGVAGAALSTVALSGGWAWSNPATLMSATSGTFSYEATYTEPSGNYLTKTGLTLSVEVAPGPDVSWYTGHSSPYHIGTAAELRELAYLVNNGTDNFSGDTVMLDSSIYLNPGMNVNDTVANGDTASLTQWTAIGNDPNFFKGTFDGQGHAVSGVYINNDKDYQGLFGIVNSGTLRNVGVVNAYIKSSGSQVGGLAGIVNTNATVERCYSEANVSGTNDVGGLFGYGMTDISISDCYATGNVNAQGNAGALAGRVNGSGISFTSCYASGAVQGSGGGLVGSAAGATFTHCYFNSERASDNGNGTPKTTAELQQQRTFAGYIFGWVWKMPERELGDLAGDLAVHRASIPDGIEPLYRPIYSLYTGRYTASIQQRYAHPYRTRCAHSELDSATGPKSPFGGFRG